MFVAAPGVEILDLVGPLQVFARASEMHAGRILDRLRSIRSKS